MKIFFIKLHRYLGLVLSLVFVIWFFSGFVMMFSSFPKPMKAEYARLNSPIHPHITLNNTDSIKSLVLHTRMDEAMVSVTWRNGKQTTYSYPGMQAVTAYSEMSCRRLAVRRAKATVAELETISDYDRWIPWERYKDYFPIYKYRMNDGKGTVLYISSVTGEIVQETNRTTRLWAYFGAMPHWVYIKQLRLHANCWKNTIIVISALGSIICLAGLWLGLGYSRKAWKRRKTINSITPYKHFWFRWHHILGLLFGLVTFTYVFSGMMSLCEVPQFIARSLDEFDIRSEVQVLPLVRFTRDVNEVLTHYPQTNRIEWNIIGGMPYYKICDMEGCISMINGDRTKPGYQPMFNKKELQSIYSKQIGQHSFSLTLQKEYDNDHIPSQKRLSPLPVYRLDIDDEFKTTLYIHPKTSELLVEYNNNTRIRRWAYNFLHSFNSCWLMEHSFWRRLLEIVLLSGGMALSVTGVVLTVKRSKR